MPKLWSAFAGALFFLLSVTSQAHAVVVINDDHGGIVDEYINHYLLVRSAGEHLRIDGECVSACTLFLGIVPLRRVCITPNAKLGFHSASWVNSQTRETGFSEKATQRMWLAYPEEFRKALRAKGFNGGEHPEVLTIEGAELRSLIQPCREEGTHTLFKSIRAAIAAVRNWVVLEEQSVETILKGWFSAVKQIEQHAVKQAELVLMHNRVAVRAGELAAAAQDEVNKAQSAAEKIKAVLS